MRCFSRIAYPVALGLAMLLASSPARAISAEQAYDTCSHFLSSFLTSDFEHAAAFTVEDPSDWAPDVRKELPGTSEIYQFEVLNVRGPRAHREAVVRVTRGTRITGLYVDFNRRGKIAQVQSIRGVVTRHGQELAAATAESLRATEDAKTGKIAAPALLKTLREQKVVVKKYMAALEDYLSIFAQSPSHP